MTPLETRVDEQHKLELCAEEYCRQNNLDPNELVSAAYSAHGDVIMRAKRVVVIALQFRDLRERLSIMGMVFDPPRLNLDAKLDAREPLRTKKRYMT